MVGIVQEQVLPMEWGTFRDGEAGNRRAGRWHNGCLAGLEFMSSQSKPAGDRTVKKGSSQV